MTGEGGTDGSNQTTESTAEAMDTSGGASTTPNQQRPEDNQASNSTNGGTVAPPEYVLVPPPPPPPPRQLNVQDVHHIPLPAEGQELYDPRAVGPHREDKHTQTDNPPDIEIRLGGTVIHQLTLSTPGYVSLKRRHENHAEGSQSPEQKRPKTPVGPPMDSNPQYTPRGGHRFVLPLIQSTPTKPSTTSIPQAQANPPNKRKEEECKEFLSSYIPLTAKGVLEYQVSIEARNEAKSHIEMISYATVYRELTIEYCANNGNPFSDTHHSHEHQHMNAAQAADALAMLWENTMAEIGKLDEYNETKSKLLAEKLETEQDPQTDEVTKGTDAAENKTAEQLEHDANVAIMRSDAMYLPMAASLATKATATNPPFWDEQEHVLEQMVELSKTLTPQATCHRTPIRTHNEFLGGGRGQQLKAMTYNKYKFGVTKFQTKVWSADELTLQGLCPNIWGMHTRDIDEDWESYSNDPNRPEDFSNKEEYEISLTRRRRITRIRRRLEPEERTLVEQELIPQGSNTLPEESRYKTVYNAEMQLHRGITPMMYKHLGGPILGFRNPAEFWSTVNYFTAQSQKPLAQYFWVLYYLRDNGNTMDDMIRAAKTFATPAELEKYLQQGQACKFNFPFAAQARICPIHPNLVKYHSAAECALDIPFSTRMELFDKYDICNPADRTISRHHCLTSHRDACRNYDKQCFHCSKSHMDHWCPLLSYKSGTYDQVIWDVDGYRLKPILPKK